MGHQIALPFGSDLNPGEQTLPSGYTTDVPLPSPPPVAGATVVNVQPNPVAVAADGEVFYIDSPGGFTQTTVNVRVRTPTDDPWSVNLPITVTVVYFDNNFYREGPGTTAYQSAGNARGKAPKKATAGKTKATKK
jgi:hypothetical protein